MVALLAGCATPPSGPPAPAPEVMELKQALQEAREGMEKLRTENRELENRLSASRDRLRALELTRLDQTARIRELAAQRDRAIEEAVQARARLGSRQSKAEVVTHLAETRLTLEKLSRNRLDRRSAQALKEAGELLEKAEQALGEDNLDGAFYLLSRAAETIDRVRIRRTTAPGRRRGESIYLVPLKMEVRRNGNVRLAPGLKSEILFQLERGSPVWVLGRREEWLHIRTRDHRTGWMHFRLVEDSG